MELEEKFVKEIIQKCLPTYQIVEKLGDGVFGSVYRVKDRLKERAIKIVPIIVEKNIDYRTASDLDSKISQDFHAVRQYYENIKGQGVIEIYDFHLVDKRISNQDAKGYLVILMRLYPNNLTSFVLNNYPVDPGFAARLMKDLAQILKRLLAHQEESYLVTDLKPANLLLNADGQLLIGDLGGIKRLGSISTYASAQFTLNWSAPEVIFKGEKPGILAAIFSYGFVSYFIWEGRLPFENASFDERFQLVKANGLKFERKDIPEPILDLIKKCVQFDKNDRPESFSQILDEYFKDPSLLETELEPTVDLAQKPRIYINQTSRYRPGEISKDPITGMEFVWIPEGSFWMGTAEAEAEKLENEMPRHEVHIDGFWMGRFPVTNAQYRILKPNHLVEDFKGYTMNDDQQPAMNVSWPAAQDFAKRLAKLNGFQSDYRLPSEAQWEYACRGGTTTSRFWGDDPDMACQYANVYDQTKKDELKLEEPCHNCSTGFIVTSPVGSFLPNPFELYDMLGNVWEWCEDIFHPDAYRKHMPKNPVYIGSGSGRVFRGGSWINKPIGVRSNCRNLYTPAYRHSNLGFRLVKIV